MKMHELKNMMEDIVTRRIDEVMLTMECCDCEQCKLDATTYALNRLPPKYVCTESGQLLSKLETTDTQIDTMITTIVVQAIQIIKKHPHHIKQVSIEEFSE